MPAYVLAFVLFFILLNLKVINLMTKILDVVKPGVVTGENLQKLFAVARENGYAFPSVNCVGTDSINAVIEVQRHVQLLWFNSQTAVLNS